MTKPALQRALISTADKAGLVEFAQQLHSLGIALLATGNTAQVLKQAHLPVTDVADYTGFPEILGGRVKTLHPKIHGGLLYRKGLDEAELQTHGILPIDLVVVNLYPFAKTIANPNTTLPEAIEQIDIGGPSMLRAAAKNHDRVTVVVDPADYPLVLSELKQHGATTPHTRLQLATKVFAHTSAYDQLIANYLSKPLSNKTDSVLPDVFSPLFNKQADLRYGENPHQAAAFYVNAIQQAGSLAQATQLQGKPLSFNNLMDSNAALECVRALPANKPACVIVKHATPCGVATGNTLEEAYQRAFACDSSSAFGGIIAFNQALDEVSAKAITEQQFAEVVLAPSIENNALAIFTHKKNLRVLACDDPTISLQKNFTLHSISGGLLVQEADNQQPNHHLTVVTQRQPTPSEMTDCEFAWQVVKFVKSNAIVYAKNGMTLGIGTGQTSRVFSAEIAILKAQQASLDLQGAAMASDAFFPFADSLDIAIKAGITAIIQPGGSIRDEEVIRAADEANIAMIFTGIRHFKH